MSPLAALAALCAAVLVSAHAHIHDVAEDTHHAALKRVYESASAMHSGHHSPRTGATRTSHPIGAATSLPTGKHPAPHTLRIHTKAPGVMVAFTTSATTPTTTTPTITSTATLTPGGGWTEFTFGPAGSVVPTAFDIMSESPQIVRIVDLLCTGDRLAVFNNGVFIGNTTIASPDNCTEVAIEAQDAYESGNWSVFAQQLPAGNNTITMTVLESPFGSGSAAISVVDGFGVCNTTLQGLHLVTSPLARANYTDACTVLGWRPADINIYNFDDATRVVFDCVGAFASAWIGSYWENTYENSCLALYTGNAVPGAAISVPASCDAPLPALCQLPPFYF